MTLFKKINKSLDSTLLVIYFTCSLFLKTCFKNIKICNCNGSWLQSFNNDMYIDWSSIKYIRSDFAILEFYWQIKSWWIASKWYVSKNYENRIWKTLISDISRSFWHFFQLCNNWLHIKCWCSSNELNHWNVQVSHVLEWFKIT